MAALSGSVRRLARWLVFKALQDHQVQREVVRCLERHAATRGLPLFGRRCGPGARNQ